MDLHKKLQRLSHGAKSVYDYYKETEDANIRANMEKDNEVTMARFLHGLDNDISNIVVLHHYVGIDDLVHQTIKVEQQLKRKGQLCRVTTTSFNSTNYKDKLKKEGTASSKYARVETNKNVKCFKC
jgi:hypothetical protein